MSFVWISKVSNIPMVCCKLWSNAKLSFENSVSLRLHFFNFFLLIYIALSSRSQHNYQVTEDSAVVPHTHLYIIVTSSITVYPSWLPYCSFHTPRLPAPLPFALSDCQPTNLGTLLIFTLFNVFTYFSRAFHEHI